jgi:LmbE family N-acetylglucosaminyl deacetylase
MASGSRREFVRNSLGVAALSGFGFAKGVSPNEKIKIVCVGAHPDDPESGCGGTLAKLSQQGHAVTILYLTRGEAGIPKKSHEEFATIRTREAEEACSTLMAKPMFVGQIDGATLVNDEWTEKISKMIIAEKPQLVFAHWPLDAHKDHQAASMLAWRTWLKANRSFDLYFFEVCTGEQTISFHPTDYVDITSTQEIKRKAVFAHTSQDPPGIYACGHAASEEFRGREMGVKAAEAFVKAGGNSSII